MVFGVSLVPHPNISWLTIKFFGKIMFDYSAWNNLEEQNKKMEKVNSLQEHINKLEARVDKLDESITPLP